MFMSGVPRQLKAIVSTLRRGQSAGLSGYPTSEGDYDFSICGSILPLRGCLNCDLPNSLRDFFVSDSHHSVARPVWNHPCGKQKKRLGRGASSICAMET